MAVFFEVFVWLAPFSVRVVFFPNDAERPLLRQKNGAGKLRGTRRKRRSLRTDFAGKGSEKIHCEAGFFELFEGFFVKPTQTMHYGNSERKNSKLPHLHPLDPRIRAMAPPNVQHLNHPNLGIIKDGLLVRFGLTIWDDLKQCHLERAQKQPWKLTWLAGKSTIFNRKYIFIHGGFSSQSCYSSWGEHLFDTKGGGF